MANKSAGFLMMVGAAFSGLFAAQFTVQPRLVEQGDSAIITFTVSASTDVEVGIEDASGKIIRHIAAGVLGGENPAPDPLRQGLSQRLAWDGLDDYGKVSYGGPFKARVRIGVTPVFDRTISTDVFPSTWRVSLGADTIENTTDLIPMTHPMWKQGMGSTKYPDILPDGSKKIAFYAATPQLDMCVSDETDEIIIQGWASQSVPVARINGITGSLIGLWPKPPVFGLPAGGECPSTMTYYGEPAMDWFGRYVLHDEGRACNYIYRFNLAGQPAPFQNGKHIIAQPQHAGGDYRQRGLTSGPDGSIYHGHYRLSSDSLIADAGMYVSKYDSNGTPVNERLLRIAGNIGQGIRVDIKGNIFLGVRMKPYGDTVPSNIRSKLEGAFSDKYSQAYWADEMYGSIVKFGPEGGTILPDAGGDLMGAGGFDKRAKAVGVQWMHYGASMQATHSSWRAVSCWCYVPRFDVDRYGRVLFPNPFENEFKALDNNGNLIFRMHNRDLIGRVKIGSATTVQVTDRAVYLADHTNNQIVRLTWKADAETLLPISSAMAERLSPSSGKKELMAVPNPFNPVTRIHVPKVSGALLQVQRASLKIYDAAGRTVADLTPDLLSGKTVIGWDASSLTGKKSGSGVYLCRLNTGDAVYTKMLLLTK